MLWDPIRLIDDIFHVNTDDIFPVNTDDIFPVNNVDIPYVVN